MRVARARKIIGMRLGSDEMQSCLERLSLPVRRDGEQELVALEPCAHGNEIVEARPVQQCQSHCADAQLVQWERKVGVRTRQQVDAVSTEDRHVPFMKPEHRIHTDAGSAAHVAGGFGG